MVGLLAALQAHRQMRGSREVCRLHRQEPQPHALSRLPPTGLCVGSRVVESGWNPLVGRLKHSGVYYWTVDGANDILPCPAACSAAMCEDFWATGPRTPAVNRQIHGVLLVCHESAEGSEGSPADMLRKGWRPPKPSCRRKLQTTHCCCAQEAR